MALSHLAKSLGLSDEDEPNEKWWIDLCARVGLSYAQRDQGLRLYARDARKLPQMTDEEYVAWWISVANEIGATEVQLNQALLSGAKAIDHGPGSTLNIRPTAAALANERAEIESIMKKDFARYERDPELKRRYQEILEQQEEKSQLTAPTPARRASRNPRMGEIEGLMGDPRSDYWRGPESSILQEEYAQLVDHSQSAADTGDAT